MTTPDRHSTTTSARQADVPVVQPQHLEAEEHVLGAMLISAGAIDAVTGEGLTVDDFWRHSHGEIYRAIADMHERGEPVDAVTVTDDLDKRGLLEQAGGKVRVHELARVVPASANAAHYARIVRRHARLRREKKAADRLQQAVGFGGLAGDEGLAEELRELLEQRHDTSAIPTTSITGAGSFILDQPATETAVWGDGDQILWASGEAFMLVGPQGVGKSTIAQQLTLALAATRGRVLGLPVINDGRPVLYIAADRPRQIQRSLARMVEPNEREILDQRLHVWRGPLPVLLNEQPDFLARLCKQGGYGYVIVDSLKDVALDLSKDESGARVNLAIQHVLAAGVEICSLHHQRKEQQSGGKPTKLADVYGSTWLTSGHGSVALVWGEPGDQIVEFRHLKQPAEEVGPWEIQHDHEHGRTWVPTTIDLVQLLHGRGEQGLTVKDAATVLYGPTANKNDVEKARRKLRQIEKKGLAIKVAATSHLDADTYIYASPPETTRVTPVTPPRDPLTLDLTGSPEPLNHAVTPPLTGVTQHASDRQGPLLRGPQPSERDTQHAPKNGDVLAASLADIETYVRTTGWHHTDDQLEHELRELGVTDDQLYTLLDLAADLRRAGEATPEKNEED